MAIADLDGQHGNDLVVSNSSSNTVSVLLNKGGGSFATAVNYNVGSSPAWPWRSPTSTATASWTSPWRSTGGGTVSILPRQRRRHVPGTAVNFTVGSSPYAVVAANLNANNKLDLAVANYGSSTRGRCSLNQGTPFRERRFKASGTFAAGGERTITAATSLQPGGRRLQRRRQARSGRGLPRPNKVSVLLGNGDGTFQAATALTLSGGPNPYSLTAGDFNGDGITDLVTANYNSSNVSVLLGNAAVKLLPVDGTTGLESGYAQGA